MSRLQTGGFPGPITQPEHKIGRATICLRISAALKLLVGLLSVLLLVADDKLGLGPPFAVAVSIFCLGLVVGYEVVVKGLHQRQTWAWSAGICILVLLIPT
jgi:hypothetical protein